MFKSISWQDFLTGIAAILGAYYVLSILLLYSRDVYYWLASKGKHADQIGDNFTPTAPKVMGGIKQDPPKKNERSVEAEDLIIGEPVNKENRDDDSLLVGSVSDLLHEIKVLARVIKESGGSKEEGIPMFQSLLSNYPQLVGTKYQESITLFVHQHCSSEAVFEVSLDEIKSWWPAKESQNNLNNNEDEK
jgi:hypothetical protein